MVLAPTWKARNVPITTNTMQGPKNQKSIGTAARIRRAMKETKEACKTAAETLHTMRRGYPCWTWYDAPSINVPHHKVEYNYDGCYDGTKALASFLHRTIPHNCKVDAKQNQREEVPGRIGPPRTPTFLLLALLTQTKQSEHGASYQRVML